MKQINSIVSAQLKAVCRKTLLASALLCSFSMMVNAQTQDGSDFSMDGFAAYEGVPGSNWYRAGGTTGGAGGKVVKADNFSQLQAYLQATDPYIVIVDHDITTGIKCYVDDLSTGRLLDDQSGKSGVESVYGERIMVAPNKTLIGVVDPATGEAPLFSHITFVMQSVDNIIIRNCRFTMKGVPVLRTGENKIVAWRNGAQVEVGDPDCIGIQADKVSAKTNWGGHIWVDHCEFFNGDAANKDRYDGLLDCKNNVQWMTFSYNYFHDHDKSCLWGKGDSDVYDNCRTISFHHNFFDNIQGSRLPLQRGGHVRHVFHGVPPGLYPLPAQGLFRPAHPGRGGRFSVPVRGAALPHRHAGALPAACYRLYSFSLRLGVSQPGPAAGRQPGAEKRLHPCVCPHFADFGAFDGGAYRPGIGGNSACFAPSWL